MVNYYNVIYKPNNGTLRGPFSYKNSVSELGHAIFIFGAISLQPLRLCTNILKIISELILTCFPFFVFPADLLPKTQTNRL